MCILCGISPVHMKRIQGKHASFLYVHQTLMASHRVHLALEQYMKNGDFGIGYIKHPGLPKWGFCSNWTHHRVTVYRFVAQLVSNRLIPFK